MDPVFSIIVPCYNEEAVIRETHRRLSGVMQTMGAPYEILYVNDGSRDHTAQLLREIAADDRAAKVISFAGNRGHQIAVSAGLDYARGDAIVIIDADLQDPPELIPQMAEYWKNGFQVVYGKRAHRAGESAFKLWTAEAYYRVISKLTDGMIPRDTGDFRLVDRQVADTIRAMPEHARFLRGMFAWAGFKQTPLEYDREARFAGETHYPLRKMLKLAADGVFSFSMKPLKAAAWLGVFWGAAGALGLLILLILLLFNVSGGLWWLGCLMMLLAGTVLACLGIMGEYIARIFDDVRGRPLYVVAQTLNMDD
ncbi:MAG: glycosyltransferase family 2 protein [Clostridia bacterium]|nr:glycosyltransferase family 2 protein [Clostridia bacterium]